ncbi:MAG: ParB/RepB/Spo0J family partition protein [Prevotellaceae bacterium]|jgi:ParB family chromosome partitioning protein|nr:ParB/RepB/Spo0J family partition protein [Prevotellaceae bacterium]
MAKENKSRLGGGLSTLLGNNSALAAAPLNVAAGIVKSELIKEIPLSEIAPNPAQPRTHFDEAQLNELAESIKSIGLIQPITVRSLAPHSYQIIAGERRHRAAQMAGLTTIPAYVREADDNQTLLMALVENVQRADLDAIEIALSYQRLMTELDLTQEEVSDKVGKSRSAVTNFIRLLKLPPEIQRSLRDGLIEAGHARALLMVASPELQLALAKKVADKGLSVREVEKLVKDTNKPKVDKPGEDVAPDVGEDMSEVFVRLVESVEKCFGGTVNVKRGAKGGAKLTIELQSDADIHQTIERLSGLA